MPMTVSGTSGLTYPDSTTQSTATRSGSTNITFTSSNSSVTLTSASTQQQRFLTGSPVPVNPTVTLPNMTTMPAASNGFTFRSATSYNVGVNDAGGTLRQLFPTNTVDTIGIWDNSTSNGQWATTGTPLLSGYASTGTDATITGFRVGTTGATFGGTLVRLSSTEMAYVWTEQTASGSATLAIYAKLYTVNPSTNAITAGNTVTISNTINMVTTTAANWGGVTVIYDCDFAGRTLCAMEIRGAVDGANRFAYGVTFGLVASGGTLYNTTPVTQASGASIVSCCGPSVTTALPLWCSYLGSNNAFAVAYMMSNAANYPAPNNTFYYYAYTLTGTTSPVLTAGTGNGSVASVGNGYVTYSGVRPAQTLFAARTANTNGDVYTYTPASNSVSRTSLTGNTIFNVYSSSDFGNALASSIALGGYMWNTGSLVGFNRYAISYSGSGASLTAAVASAVNSKPPLMGDYSSVTGTNFFSASRKIASFNPGASQISVGSAWQTTDLTSATLNSSISTTPSGTYVTPDILLSNSCGLTYSLVGSATAYTSFTVRFVRVATPYVV